MVYTIESIIFYLILIDAIATNIVAWFFGKWYKKSAKGWAKHFPVTKAWATWYLVLVLWIGYALFRLGIA